MPFASAGAEAVPKLIELLRDDLDEADYGVDSAAALLGAAAEEARLRGVLVPARRAIREREPSAGGELIRLFLLGEALDEASLVLALPRLGVEGARALGLVEPRPDGGYRAAVSLNPVRLPHPVPSEGGTTLDWWLLSDLDDHLRRSPARPDHVMGVGGATRSLLLQAPFGAGTEGALSSALDLGTGCGAVALFLAAAGAERVVATDISARALAFARANARLNGLADRIDFRQGDLFEPIAGERFELILSNPPFVITPRDDERMPVYEYRDGGLRGDALAERVVRAAPRSLVEGGELLCLANWEYPWGGDGLERVREWIEGAAAESGPLGAWVIERDRLDPTRYAETWARDGGARPGDPGFDALVEAWLDDFAERRIVGIGLGSIRVQRLAASAGASDGAAADEDRARRTPAAAIRAEQAPEAFGPDAGAAFARAMRAGLSADRMDDRQILATHWVRDGGVSETREHRPGEEAPHAITLRVASPLERSIGADPLLAAAVGACDGELSLGRIAAALATLLEVDEEQCEQVLVPSARELAWLGVLAPAAR